MFKDLLRRSLFENITVVKKNNLIRHIMGEFHLMRDNDHRCVARGESADDLQHFSRQLRVQR